MSGRSSRNAASWGPQFNPPPPSSSQLSTVTQPPPPPKAKSRRKRHVPPGPAGVWYQAMALQQKDDDDASYLPGELSSNQTNNSSNDHQAAATDVTTCPAWVLMQLQLPLLTPYLPPYATIPQRHSALRSFLSDEYILLPDLTNELVVTKKLIVLVHAVHSHSHCDWTVELHDETGSSIHAWVAPVLVKQESEYPEKVRAGTVWCLDHVTVLPALEDPTTTTSSSSSSSSSWWLLIKEANIVKYWVPPKHGIPHDIYLQWMAKRTALPNSNCCAQVRDEYEEGEQDVESDDVETGDIPIRSVVVPRTPLNERQQEISRENEVLTADFGLSILPRLHHKSQVSAQVNESARCEVEEEVLPPDFGLQVLSSLHPYSHRMSQNSSAGAIRPLKERSHSDSDASRQATTPQSTYATVIATPTPPPAGTSTDTTPAAAAVQIHFGGDIQTTTLSRPAIDDTCNIDAICHLNDRILQQRCEDPVALQPQPKRNKSRNPYARSPENIKPSCQVPNVRTSGGNSSSVKAPEQRTGVKATTRHTTTEAPTTAESQTHGVVNAHKLPEKVGTVVERNSDSITIQEPPAATASKPLERFVATRSTISSLQQFAATNSPKSLEMQTKQKRRQPTTANQQQPPQSPPRKKIPKVTKSPIAATLWSASAGMMDIFDEQEEEGAATCPNHLEIVTGSANNHQVAQQASSCENATTLQTPTLFQVSNFAGMDMIGMFDD